MAATAIVSLSPPPDATILPTADTFKIQFDRKVQISFKHFVITHYILIHSQQSPQEKLELLELGAKYLIMAFKCLMRCCGTSKLTEASQNDLNKS